MGVFTRAIRPPDDVTPNPNPPESVPPGTVGPPSAVPGDPHGVTLEGPDAAGVGLPAILPSAWSGWPAEWWPPAWSSRLAALTDTAWTCLDLNAGLLATMPPYLVNAAPSLDTAWIQNPDPDRYTSWEEFAKQLFWDYQGVGEAFVLSTARYESGYPARFHVVPPWFVSAEMDGGGGRRYSIGEVDVTPDVLHVRYSSTVDDARGHGPLEAGRARLIASEVISRYATGLLAGGGVPASLLEHPEELTADQSAALQAQWVQARASSIGLPAVLSGGVTWRPVQLNPRDMALQELAEFNEARIAVMLRVPPFLVGLPTGGDSMTYSNVTSLFDYHWRAGLRPMAQYVLSALSAWLTPRGTSLEVNRDAYVQPPPKERAETSAILNNIRDPQGNPVLSVEEIRRAERFDVAAPSGLKG